MEMNLARSAENVNFTVITKRCKMNTHDLDLLEINLQKEIDNPKHKNVCTFETRVDLLAYDCLKVIRSLREQVKEKWNTRVEVQDGQG
jgi:3-dehydroquinate dehydratase